MSSCPTTTFEHQIVQIKSERSAGLILINIYRPPNSWNAPALFFDELEDLLSKVVTSTDQCVAICGDLNCHGVDSTSIDDRLAASFESLNLTQHVKVPTRNDNLLDVLVCSDNGSFVHDVSVDEVGGASDHRLIKARFSLTWRRWTSITYNYRPLSSMDYDMFEQNIRKSALFTNPAQTADLFTVQMEEIITAELDELAPLKTVTRKSGGKPINRFLSREASDAKRERRRLE